MGQLAFMRYPEVGERNLMEPLFMHTSLISLAPLSVRSILDLFFSLSQSLMMMWETLSWIFIWLQR
jgi:hypothetical protein